MYEGRVLCEESEFGDGPHDVAVKSLEPSERLFELKSVWALDEQFLVSRELCDEGDGSEMPYDVRVLVALRERLFDL